ncbi:MAG: cupin domain-containing protein [Candidatus Sumerlaeota bacterium]|nr:cupin domain-containing protein [Candidatus Sumerlaeota bacterium]
MSHQSIRRFITAKDVQTERLPWGPHEWICRPGITAAEKLMLVRVTMPPGKAHKFHTHPCQEEIVYVLAGRAEQWVDKESKTLGAGEAAHIPAGVAHATHNAGETDLVFLAMLSPARFDGPGLVDVSNEAPWASLQDPSR